jgi:serine/threonine-protein kinase ATR
VFRFDIPTSLFLMPYLVHNVLAHGTDAARAGVQQEIQAVLAGASSSREGTLCCQACFSLLDTLQKWHGDAKAAQRELGSAAAAQQQQPGGRPGESGQQYASMGPEWDAVHQLLEAMPKQLLAQAASQVGWVERACVCGDLRF